MTAYLEDLFSPGRGRYGWPISSSAYDVDLVDSLLDEVDPASVLDPLCGVGTVNLACSYRGVGCVGLEPDPFRQTVASAKLRMYREDTYEECGYACARVCDNLFWEDEKYEVPDIPGAYRFGARQTDFLRRLRYQIGEERDSASRDIMMLALFRTVVSMVRDTTEEGFDDSVGLELFGDSVAEVREGIAPPLSSPSRAYLCDPRDIPYALRKGYDLILSFLPPPSKSPMYREVRSCMQWSGAFRSQEDLCDADRRSVGRPIGAVRSFTDGWSPKTPVPTSLTDTLDGLTPSDVLFVRRYFEDLEHLFISLKGVMRADTSACFFVGNAQMDGVTVRVAEVIPEIVGRAGLRVEDVTKVRVRDARRDLEDYRIDVSRVAG